MSDDFERFFNPANADKEWEPPKLSKKESLLLEAQAEIFNEEPEGISFNHSLLCQVGFPRKKVEGRTFERRSGKTLLEIEAGKIYNGRELVLQDIPYGAMPRLIMVYISSQALRSKSPCVEVGDSMRDFMARLGLPTTGGQRGGYTMFKRQMEAVAACRLTLGYNDGLRAYTIDAKPIHKFETWLQRDNREPVLWPGKVELSKEFFETLQSHAVPLDPRALAAIKGSALALDVYCWLASRLYRIKPGLEVKISWQSLKEQFGHEYCNMTDFRKKFRKAVAQVWTVYQHACINLEDDGLYIRQSRPPVLCNKQLPLD